MILVNKVEKKLSEKFSKEILTEIGIGRYLQIPQEHYVKHETNIPGLTRQIGPSNVSILLNDQFHGIIDYNEKGEIDGIQITDKGGATWHTIHYCNRVTRERDEIKTMTPEYLTGAQTIQKTDVDLFFYLGWVCRRVKGSKNNKVNTQGDFALEIADPEGDASTEINAGKAEAEVRYLIVADASKGGWDENQLRLIGRQLFLPVDNYKTTALLQKAILQAAAADQKQKKLSGEENIFGWDFVLKIANKKAPNYKDKETITDAISRRFVKYDLQRQQWVFANPGLSPESDVIIGNICACESTAPIKENVLLSFLKFNPDIMERIEGMVDPAPKAEAIKKKKAEAAE